MTNSVIQAFLVRTKTGVSVSEFERVAAESNLFVKKLGGFISRRLFHTEGEGPWLDVIEWASWEAAEKAAEAIEASADCLEFISMIDEKEIQELRLREVSLEATPV